LERKQKLGATAATATVPPTLVAAQSEDLTPEKEVGRGFKSHLLHHFNHH